MRAPASIVAIATVLLIGSVLVPAGSFYILFVNQAFLHALLPIIVIQIAFSCLGIITSIGLLLLREPARKAAIFLSTAPVLILLFSLVVLLGASRSTHNLFFAIPFLICGAVFVLLLPISVWGLILLRRDDVRSQFHLASCASRLVTKGPALCPLWDSHHSHLGPCPLSR